MFCDWERRQNWWRILQYKILYLKCHLFVSWYLECANTGIPGYIVFQKCYVFFIFMKCLRELWLSHNNKSLFPILNCKRNIHEIFHPWIKKRTLKYKIHTLPYYVAVYKLFYAILSFKRWWDNNSKYKAAKKRKTTKQYNKL